ncbi:hypothetical protein M670_03590 [Schinkia azotoformans MEV2011]|uniref:Uncharacterized protein n=1 Tax=Schinkia azotoformans MEV2011 TaxID=1348973 RepID=A0A072NJV5_SCHAZ|nr:hypothetical protein M670_03590 [Schinkia azotoformans MEV2011]
MKIVGTQYLRIIYLEFLDWNVVILYFPFYSNRLYQIVFKIRKEFVLCLYYIYHYFHPTTIFVISLIKIKKSEINHILSFFIEFYFCGTQFPVLWLAQPRVPSHKKRIEKLSSLPFVASKIHFVPNNLIQNRH